MCSRHHASRLPVPKSTLGSVYGLEFNGVMELNRGESVQWNYQFLEAVSLETNLRQKEIFAALLSICGHIFDATDKL